jgi:hypothetical protein
LDSSFQIRKRVRVDDADVEFVDVSEHGRGDLMFAEVVSPEEQGLEISILDDRECQEGATEAEDESEEEKRNQLRHISLT